MNEEPILRVLRQSRKVYVLEYLCGFFLLGLLIATKFWGIFLPRLIVYGLVGFSLFCFLSAEFSRLILRYKVTPTKIVTIYGFVKQSKKNIYFHPLAFVPDINIKQNRIQRIMNYGTVFLSGGESALMLKDVDNPQQVMEMIEQLIAQNKRGQSLMMDGGKT